MIRVAEFNSAVELVAWLAGQQQMILAVAPGNEPARVNPALCDQILPHGLCPAFGELLIVFGAPTASVCPFMTMSNLATLGGG